MPPTFFKTLKMAFWAIIPFFFVSSGVGENNLGENTLLVGRYTLKTSGDFSEELKGTADFETSIETSVKGGLFSTLKLNLKNIEHAPLHSLEFLISKQNKENRIPVGTYGIVRDIDGFLDCFDGAFGYANISDLGEAPLFAHDGKVIIHRYDKNGVRGAISVNLKNIYGKRIYVAGSFIALKKANK